MRNMEVITTHTNADFDTLASMVAAKKLYPDALVVFPGSKEKGVRDFLLKSTLYSLEMGRIQAIDLESITRLILVDIRDPSRIGRFAEILDKPGLEIHIYDHHPSSPEEIRGDVEYILPYGSTTTILTHLIMEKGIEITPEEATIMLLGIYEDTGFLSYPSTTPKDLEAAAFLLSRGGDLNVVSEVLKRELNREDLNLLRELIDSARTFNIGGVDILITEAAVEHRVEDIALIVHKMREICNVPALFAFILMEDKIHLIARSRTEDVDVGRIAKGFGGGGHPTAASATIKGSTLIEAKERLLCLLKENIRPRKKAEELMSFPPITVCPGDRIEKVRGILIRYNINALPVVEDHRVVGIITRQVAEKAFYHGLGRVPVGEYMATDFEAVQKDAPLSRVKEIVIEHNQRLLPVLDGDRIVGVITRTDLLRSMEEVEEKGPIGDFGKVRKRYVRKLLEERLPERVVNLLKTAGEVAEGLGFKAYAVGGFVRDLILGNENLDVDIVIEGDGIIFAKSLGERFGCKVRPYQRFKTAVLVFPDGFKVDVATARLEYYERPGALPTIEKSSIKLDLYRRDFTINTLAICLNPSNFGELLDFYGGLRDIKAKTIRVLHSLSFVEDPTRVFRAVRFEQRFGFAIGKHTMRLIKNAIRLELFKTVERRRFFVELKAILSEEDPVSIIKRLGELDLLRFIHPSIRFDRDMNLLLDRTRDVMSWFRLLYMKERVEEWLFVYLVLTDSLSQRELTSLSEGFGVGGRRVWEAIRQREEVPEIMNRLSGDLKPSEIYHLLHPLHLEVILYIMAKAQEEVVKKHISLYLTQLRKVRPSLTGRDLKELGIPEGPLCGRILKELLKKRLDGEIKGREEEIHYVRTFMERELTRA